MPAIFGLGTTPAIDVIQQRKVNVLLLKPMFIQKKNQVRSTMCRLCGVFHEKASLRHQELVVVVKQYYK